MLVWKNLENLFVQPFGKVPAFEDGDFKLFGIQVLNRLNMAR